MKKKGPVILILSLVILLVFVLGIRYGQSVEKTNEVIDFLISLPPSPTTQPTQAPLEIKTYINKACGMQFSYPSYLKKTAESSESAKLEGPLEEIFFDCSINNNKSKELFEVPPVSTNEATFQNKKIRIKIKPEENGAKAVWSFKLINPLNNKIIYLGLSDSLYPLLEKSIEFMK